MAQRCDVGDQRRLEQPAAVGDVRQRCRIELRWATLGLDRSRLRRRPPAIKAARARASGSRRAGLQFVGGGTSARRPRSGRARGASCTPARRGPWPARIAANRASAASATASTSLPSTPSNDAEGPANACSRGRELARGGRELGPAVVLAHQQQRQLPQRGQVQALVQHAFGHRAVAEEADGHAAGAQHLVRQRAAQRDRDAGADDAIGTQDAQAQVSATCIEPPRPRHMPPARPMISLKKPSSAMPRAST
jgi:hypothetical protein